jgi:hypothetical protein
VGLDACMLLEVYIPHLLGIRIMLICMSSDLDGYYVEETSCGLSSCHPWGATSAFFVFFFTGIYLA